MSTQDNITDALTRHQIFVLRYAKGRENDAADFIAQQMFEVINRLESGVLTEFGAERAEEQLRDLYQYLRATNKDYADDFKAEMSRFAEYEANFNGRVLEREIEFNMTLPSPIQLQQAAFGRIMSLEPSKGYTIGSLIDGFGPANAQFVVDKIRSGITLGDTTDTIIGDIQSIIPLQQRKASTIARTVTNHVSNVARSETLKENDDVLLGYQWVSTLDSRTSLICMARDGVIYRDWDNDPKPPAHFNCRSTITAKVNPEYDLGADIEGDRPAVGPNGPETVSADTSYSEWLKRQPESFQDEVLGKKRAQLFREGIGLDRFADARGRPLTIAELGALDGTYNVDSNSIDDILSQLAEAEALERARPKPVIPDTTNVLPDIYSSTKNITRDGINSVLERIQTPEMAKLKQFMREKEIKTVIVTQAQMSRTGKSARAIAGDVKQYLQSSSNPSNYYEQMAGSSEGYWRAFYTIRNPTRTNGFTSFVYDHIVVKGGTKARFNKPDEIAKDIKEAVTDLAGFSVDGDFKPWSFSAAVKRLIPDPAQREAASKVLTLIHELGHQVHYFADGRVFPTELYKYRMTEYGTYDSAESHAEAFVAWVVNRDAMAKRSPELAEYFDDLMEVALKSKQRSGVK